MAEFDADSLKKVQEALAAGIPEKLKNVQEELIKTGKVSAEQFPKLQAAAETALKKVGGAIEAAKTEFADFALKIKETDLFSGITTETFDRLKDSILKVDPELAKIGLQALNLTAKLSGALPSENAFTSISQAAKASSQDIQTTIGNVSQALKSLSLSDGDSKSVKTAMALAVVGQQARDFKVGMIQTAAASGQLNDMLGSLGGNLGNLDNKMIEFAKMNQLVGNATGFSSSNVGKWAQELNKIPGALDELVTSSSSASGKVTLLEAAIRLTASTGMDFAQINRQLSNSFTEFGTVGEKAIQVVARMSTASQNLRLPLDLVEKYTNQTAQSFRFFGDNSQAALNILNKFGPALKNSGLGPKAIADLTAGMTQNIAQMSTAQNAFLSQSSGGPGGLRGAAQIEKLKREGKLDEVQSMVEKSLKQQFGGKIIGLDEATQDEGLAAQREMQKMLLSQGPTKIANSPEEASRMLEAMKKNESGALKSISDTPNDALQKTIDKGVQVQDSILDATIWQNNFLENQSAIGSVIAERQRKDLTGVGGVATPLLGASATPEMDMRTDSARATNFKMYQQQVGDQVTSPGDALYNAALSSQPIAAMSDATGEAASRGEEFLKKRLQDLVNSNSNGVKVPVVEETVQQRIDMQSFEEPKLKTQSLIQQSNPSDGMEPNQLSRTSQTSTIELILKSDVSKEEMGRIAIEIVDGRMAARDTSKAIRPFTGSPV